MNVFALFRRDRPADTLAWHVDERDVIALGRDDQTGLWGYRVTFRRGRQEIETVYRWPTEKPIAKVVAFARTEC
jgi:hypothetical protein